MMSISKILKAGAPLAFAGAVLASTSCAMRTAATRNEPCVMEVSVPNQKMALYRKGQLVKTYPVSTSKFGLGDEKGSYRTPLGKMEVAKKIGDGKPAGAVFKSRVWTGEVIPPDSPGRDPIVSRILWLRGLEPQNQNTFERCIYIHGTAAERDIGRPVSYGCVRMKSRDVIDLYNRVGEGSKVFVVRRGLWRDLEKQKAVKETVIETLPPVDPVAAPAVLPDPALLRATPVWNETAHFRTGIEVLEEAGFERDYLLLPDSSDLGLD